VEAGFVSLRPAHREPVELDLARGTGTVVAVVRDPSGEPVRGASVLLVDLETESLPNAVLEQTRVPGNAVSWFGGLRAARTDSEGRAVLPGTFPGWQSERIDGAPRPRDDAWPVGGDPARSRRQTLLPAQEESEP
jgi:hypothetical protein